MERKEDGLHLNTEEASGGTKPGIVRYVLAVSLILAIVLLTAIWVTGAATS